MQYIKIVVVGDGAVGKTSLLISYSSGGFPRDYQPTVFDNFSSLMMFNGKAFSLGLFDTAGQEDFDRLRPLSFNNTDVFLICYSVVNPPSFQNVVDKWYTELCTHTSNVPIVLVGTQNDLRNDKNTLELLSLKEESPITYEQGMMMRKKIQAKSFTECSVVSQKGVKQVFQEVIKVYLDNQSQLSKNKKKQDNCIIL